MHVRTDYDNEQHEHILGTHTHTHMHTHARTHLLPLSALHVQKEVGKAPLPSMSLIVFILSSNGSQSQVAVEEARAGFTRPAHRGSKSRLHETSIQRKQEQASRDQHTEEARAGFTRPAHRGRSYSSL